MIYVEKSVLTKVALTLSESGNLLNPFYFFEVISEFNTSLPKTYFYLPDLSGYPNRFNLFEFDLDLPKGQYTYNVYEAEEVPTELSDTTGIVIETGILIVHSIEDITNDIYL